MSKRNKNKNKNYHKTRAPVDNMSQKSTEEEGQATTLNSHLEEMELQSTSASSSDSATTTIAKTDDAAPKEVRVEEKKESTQLSDSVKSETKADKEKAPAAKLSEIETEGGSNKAVWSFGMGLLIGAILVSVLF